MSTAPHASRSHPRPPHPPGVVARPQDEQRQQQTGQPPGEYCSFRTTELRQCHADTVDVAVVGFTGTARHPRALAVRLPDGHVTLSQRLTTALATRIAPHLHPRTGQAATTAGDAYTPTTGEVTVEVVAAPHGTRWSRWSGCADQPIPQR
ncbi:hypothetical protein [Streptomyces pseudovenezuelae]|uniref:Uncharacterized protein n=1 Tax=Streptomyces pseudovenezuelae TaxID=67350 RepID=A0ABT6M0G8_9ACTN|nr:hypothetical protein [Streptomyces pseudovenezuelae]MDH6222062.1 hypothetical protein [Streptomyces pseudovenezuelae]